ncbi:Auxin responsive SAUR protein [Corchorus olitorius]|uniref:Auxin responsive SAUR protein n=1 Tax=Corchorus olitorius TaxID=93759 RepID=A0A1R3K7S2_9ROSI|nr:Auxin responsive SAUR protein [Corchorus olitorius]
MAIRLPSIMHAKQILRRSNSNRYRNQSTSSDVPKGYIAVYVGEGEMKRFVIPISFLNQPCFQELLCMAEEEYGFEHPMGGLTIPCSEDDFIERTSHLGGF